MAINISDFDKIWASTSPLTPYAFSDANYQQGWNFVGATPPARQMWDFIQKQNDEKTQWLYNNKLSLSGGTVTGATYFTSSVRFSGDNSGGAIYKSNNYVRLIGGESLSDTTKRSAYISLADLNSTDRGNFEICSADASNNVALVGKPNGELTWDGNDITPQKFSFDNSTTDVSLANGTPKTLHSFSLDKGTWLVIGRGYFANNSTGYRDLLFSTTDNGGAIDGFAHARIQAPNGQSCFMQVMYIFSVATTTTYYLVGTQNSGVNLNASGGIMKFRLSSIN